MQAIKKNNLFIICLLLVGEDVLTDIILMYQAYKSAHTQQIVPAHILHLAGSTHSTSALFPTLCAWALHRGRNLHVRGSI